MAGNHIILSTKQKKQFPGVKIGADGSMMNSVIGPASGKINKPVSTLFTFSVLKSVSYRIPHGILQMGYVIGGDVDPAACKRRPPANVFQSTFYLPLHLFLSFHPFGRT